MVLAWVMLSGEEKGVSGIICEIDGSLAIHKEAEEIEFLNALKTVAYALIEWAHKCSDMVW